MKVRVKTQGNVEYTVIEESPNYYILQDPKSPISSCFSGNKQHYEPVQEWVDETGQHDGPSAMGLLARSNYRLVRCEVSELHNKYKAYAYLLEKVKK